ncbi:xanthine dehydrogenase family protein molybdopterin-binding subunit [Clostridium beijerinckii]|uniref:CO/xanthine dehydrogenase Mo-binding subunit n=1 Tax=Clostridium beijerinckii TaxID=1520 RepID=A0AAE5LR81_CLOBE|nr:xanthine dehydrogenase family protein molybdopterin-binding subunit [Clostridium beijerinckii]NOW03534.1 CO/xanthine dehydrogenase Mo-binding subunit [Clostridium beijerinckii]NRT71089.1 CO/xanthine dehydrogenase Mo-binding subunit [Clostridium beijerinckii]NSB15471.1 CO/xanthine dehydrogenase Mo-binding subunit [Clostridium beijerinckii]NYC03324.1 CO/xanthine dehydrogenase Mo-binding subunit [Clostridium beijerinckii]OOM25764.1 putative xanthine dehydrogenase subunit D [Clostridium beijeri
MEKISESVKKKDHESKIKGSALFVDDRVMDGMLYGKLLHSAKAKARIANISIPKLPEGYFVVDKKDVTGVNRVHIVEDDTPVYAEDTVEYVGEPILMVVGPKFKEVERILNEIIVAYEEEVPILDMRKSDTVFFHYNYAKGDIDKTLKEADRVFIETFQTGYQEQAYLETQGMIAYPHDGRMTVRGSMQCPYYVYGAVSKALGYEAKDIQIIQDVTGGGFGGKEAFPSILACQVAVAAKKANRPVKVIFDRREDMEFTSKRHPSISTYKVAIKNGKITGMDIDVLFNSGAYTTLSPVVLQRGLICANGVYRVDNLRVEGRAVKTNTVPCGAYRGFGAPQTFFAVEMIMDHIAKEMGVDSLKLKEEYIVKQGDSTSTSGKYHFHVPLPEMIEQIDKLCNYRVKREQYKIQNGRYRKGIGMSLFFHGCGFTGSGERDFIKAVAKIRKNSDDTVDILASNSDIGQGLKTTFSKIVADTLGISYEQVFINNPDTDLVPDSGPTVASRSLMTVGELLRRAAERLKKEWKSGEVQVIEEHFVEPDFVIPFSLDEFKGDAYPTYSWGVNAIEVEVDTLTATTKILGAWGSFDVGVPIDMNIIQGQMQGGFLQGIGYASMEQMDYNDKGVIRNNSFSDYIIPTAVDVPNLVTEIINNPYTHGPYGAKGAGELPLVGAAPAYVEAMENAIGGNLNKVPFTTEDTMMVLQEVHK